MNNITRDILNEDGTIDTMIISSEDNYTINLNKKYKLTNCYRKNSFSESFKNSIFGADIGVNSKGFASVALLSFTIASLGLVILYFMFRIK